MPQESARRQITAAHPCPTSFADLLSFYSDTDESISEKLGHASDADAEAAAEQCRAARHLAARLRLHYRTRSAEEIARAYGVELLHEQWPLVCGRVVYLAESRLRPPQIKLNRQAAAKLAELGERVPGEAQEWFGKARVTEVVIAHELYHVVAEQPSRPAVEVAAHAFARELTGLPFSPLLYEAMLREVVSSQ
jgi:hypothetical protein